MKGIKFKINLIIALFALVGFSESQAQTKANLKDYLVQDYNPEQTEVITASGLFIVAPEVKTFENEQSEAAQNYFVAMDDRMYYSSQLIQWFEKRSIPGHYTSKRYLKIVGAQQEWVVDTQKKVKGRTIDAIVYKAGQAPIMISLYENMTASDRLIDYLKRGKGKFVSDTNQLVINRLSASIHSHSFLYGSKTTNYKDLARWNQKLTTVLIQYSRLHPQFLAQNNPFLQNNYLGVLTSTDNKFRIICWNDGMNGTMQEWRAIAFWKTKSGIKAKVLEAGDSHRNIYGLMPQYWNIVDYKLDDGKTVYLVRGIGYGSNRIKMSFVKSFAIIPSGKLNDSYELFKTPIKTLNHISLEIDLMTAPRDDYNPYIHLSKDWKTLYIPLADKKGKVTAGKHLIYRFNGRYFVFQGVE